MATISNSGIEEVTVSIQGKFWEFEMEPSASPYDDWYPPVLYRMLLLDDAKGRPLAGFYEAEDTYSYVDLLDERASDPLGNADLIVPWDVFCACVVRLGEAEEGERVPIPGNGSFLAEGEYVIYTTSCDRSYRLRRETLEALAR